MKITMVWLCEYEFMAITESIQGWPDESREAPSLRILKFPINRVKTGLQALGKAEPK